MKAIYISIEQYQTIKDDEKFIIEANGEKPILVRKEQVNK